MGEWIWTYALGIYLSQRAAGTDRRNGPSLTGLPEQTP
jgi:hypothetical protein